MEFVKSSVLNEKVRWKTQGSSSSHSEVLVTENKGRSKSKDFFILYDDDVINVASQETRWVIDSGASIHATSRKDLSTSYAIGNFGTIKMGNDGLAKVISIGDVCLEMDNSSSLLHEDVKHIPDIHLNLISTGRLDDEGYCNTSSDGQWKLTMGAMVMA
ncbi:hypothetical protein Pint_07357 [Pistacia integerrima]|uniref:Uncharacterized protein n=1 Tax=Pistacia integerrima TaxID=434235 RepID=A0ACC0XWE3_9ROSI|nr:hypothetical protein Pint_07357 [Pistacia integerrima]